MVTLGHLPTSLLVDMPRASMRCSGLLLPHPSAWGAFRTAAYMAGCSGLAGCTSVS